MADEVRRKHLHMALEVACQDGPIPFETFMDLALYHPEGGFYTRPGMTVGQGGDFHTSVSLDPAFGICLARHLEQVWDATGRPRTLRWVELGPGTGDLAHQILGELLRSRGGWATLECVLVERSPSLRARQKARLAPYLSPRVTVRWVDDLTELAPPGTYRGHILSNEFFDALAVRRVIGTSDGFAEIGVLHEGGGRFRQVGMVPTTPELAEALDRAGVTLRPGQQTELGLIAARTMRTLVTWLGCGTVLTIDYGGAAREVHAPHRMKGSIRGYWRQLRMDDPLAHPGEQDLTADVDFSALSRVGEEAGARTLGLVFQGEFLQGLGIAHLEAERLAGIEGALTRQEVAAPIRRLYRPEAMGDGFRVLVQEKGTGLQASALSGLSGDPWRPTRRPGWPRGPGAVWSRLFRG